MFLIIFQSQEEEKITRIQVTVSVVQPKFCESFRCTVPKLEAKSDSRPLLEMNIARLENALKKTFTKKKDIDSDSY